MNLLGTLAAAIEQEVSRFDRKALVRAAQELSLAYRGGSQPAKSLVRSDLHRAAYLVTRFPATHAAVLAVLEEARQRLTHTNIHSLLDLGAGPGTAAWAAVDSPSEIQQITLVERDAEFIRLGKELAAHSQHSALRNAEWMQADLRSITELPARDLVVLSYSLGELTDAAPLLSKAWAAARVLLVVIEPGTPRGFQTILTARRALIAADAQIAAPCPHQLECPMASIAGEWCHFAARLERSQLHRRAKGATMGYEDEKFSYIVAAKSDVTRASSRIVRHPVQRKGHIAVELCTPHGLKKQVVTKSDREAFRRARQARWGDEWELHAH